MDISVTIRIINLKFSVCVNFKELYQIGTEISMFKKCLNISVNFQITRMYVPYVIG